LVGGIYEEVDELGSGSMIYIQSFIKIGLMHLNVNGGIHTHRQHGDYTFRV
jgi:hypothetical protein